MDFIDDIGLCIASCGGCCSKPQLCDSCRIQTMKSNGLKPELAETLKGLPHRGDTGWPNNVEFKLRDLMRVRENFAPTTRMAGK